MKLLFIQIWAFFGGEWICSVYTYKALELMCSHFVKYMMPKCILVSWLTVLEIGYVYIRT